MLSRMRPVCSADCGKANAPVMLDAMKPIVDDHKVVVTPVDMRQVDVARLPALSGQVGVVEYVVVQEFPSSGGVAGAA